ncbi:Zn-dependent exopeptidase M28 [Methanoculleus sp. Wushi-C6]|uniref:Zn-dependent exopeptidase M28 n=1 Tax=Methanoculleus caldifontis TaxID=2651577 RepID=A0ABU3WYI6_9EURY|nr:M28 family metallopeptidase [Methanoculleus sp. Wushi-C6]MDV2480865.1 Zn-dependent exopeptidase M28 [Methanoculleus sp. Wushi-C6]
MEPISTHDRSPRQPIRLWRMVASLMLLTGMAVLLMAPPAGAAGMPEEGAEYRFAVAAMLEEIDETELQQTTRDLEEFPTRVFGTDGNHEAGEYLHRRLAGIPGLSVEFQGGDLRNVVATLPGSGEAAGEVVVVGAHYDSTSWDPARAPGATDNGCGVAIVLELARVMSGHSFDRTVRFAFWNAEEDGRYGSAAYAESAADSSDPIPLYLNYDSACYDPEDRFVLDLMYDERSKDVAALMAEYNALYGINFTLTENAHACASDHIPFRDRGYPAVTTHCEEHGPAHTPDDTLDHVSFPYAAGNARLGLAVLTETAVPRDNHESVVSPNTPPAR